MRWSRSGRDSPAPPSVDPDPAQSLAPEGFDERRLRVLVEFSAALRWPMVSTVLMIGAVAWAGGSAPIAVVGWMLLALLVREVRAASLVRLLHQVERPISARLRLTEAWTLALGIAHGSAALFMLRVDTAFDAILTMILMSLSAGAVSTTFTVARAFAGYATGISIPIAALWLLGGGWIGAGIAILVLMFLGVQIRFSQQNFRLFEESFRMRLENAALLRELSEERARLAQARDAAVQADLAKSRFLASASHDLRQPLQSLSLNSGALSRMGLSGESQSIAAEMSAGIESLRQMLDALLDISKLDAGVVSPNFQSIPLDRFLEGICARFRSAATARGVALDCAPDAGLVVTSDAEMLRRILSNLIDNSLKFTREGRVTVSATKQDARIVLCVEDTGCGFDEKDRTRVREDMGLGNHERNRAFGHGLGLGIVRRLARLLGAEVEIESSIGVGTRVRLYLPPYSLDVPLMPSTIAQHPALIAKRVLVLDDEAAVRTAYGNALRSLGCRVTCVATLGEALQALGTNEPEIALVDYRLTGENGVTAIERLRAVRPGLAAVLVSADMSASLREEAARLAVPLLRKPVTDATLATSINEALLETRAVVR